MELRKNDRVRFVHSRDGVMLGVVGKVSRTRGSVEFISDTAWRREPRGWTHSVYTVRTLVEVPGRFYRVPDPLPAHCSIPNDDPMVMAGFTGRVTDMMEGHDGYCYRIKVLKSGKPTGITFFEEGRGGEVEYGTHGVPQALVDDFEAAAEAWVQHHGIIGPHHRYPIHGWDVWQDHVVSLYDYRNMPANFPLGLAYRPEPWGFTFEEDESDETPEG